MVNWCIWVILDVKGNISRAWLHLDHIPYTFMTFSSGSINHLIKPPLTCISPYILHWTLTISHHNAGSYWPNTPTVNWSIQCCALVSDAELTSVSVSFHRVTCVPNPSMFTLCFWHSCSCNYKGCWSHSKTKNVYLNVKSGCIRRYNLFAETYRAVYTVLIS